MKKYLLILVSLLALTGVALAAPTATIQRTIIPETTDTYSLGSTLKRWLGLEVKNLTIGELLTLAPIVIKHKDGGHELYNPASDTDAARGTALLTAISEVVAGDTIALANNTYTISSPVTIPAANVSLVGSSPLSTIIQANIDNALVYATTSTYITGIKISNLNDGTASQALNIGTATNVEIESAILSGGVDTLSVGGGTVRLHGVHWEDSAYDGGVITSGTVTIQDCSADASPESTNESSFLNILGGTVTILNSDIKLTRAEDEANLSYIRTASGSPTILSQGNRIKISASSMAAYGFSETSFSSPNITSVDDYFELSAATTAHINAPDGLGTYNILGGNITDITGSPTVNYLSSSYLNMPGATIGTLSGLLEAASGVVSTATAGVDYLTPTGNGSALTGLTQSQISGLTTASSPTFTGATLSGGVLTGKSGESIEIGVTDDYIDLIGSAGGTNQTLRVDLDDAYGPRLSTTGALIAVEDYLAITSTDDSYGRLLEPVKTNYDLSSGNTKYPVNIGARASVVGSRAMYGTLNDIRMTAASGTQTGTMTGFYNQIYHSGAATLNNTNKGIQNTIILASGSTMTTAYGSDNNAYIIDATAGTIGTAINYMSGGIDAEDGTITSAYGFYSSPHIKDTGTLTNAYGAYFAEQTAASTINYEAFFAGAGEVFFRDAAIHTGSLTDGHLDLTADVSVDVNAPVLVLPVKTDTGDPTGQEGAIYVNTFDNKVRVYADGAWRDLLAY